LQLEIAASTGKSPIYLFLEDYFSLLIGIFIACPTRNARVHSIFSVGGWPDLVMSASAAEHGDENFDCNAPLLL
jgi:hypothetical protein